MKKLIETIDNLPLIAKILLCIPALDIIWWVYRICKSLDKNNMVGLVIAIVLLVVGIPFMWLIDLICVLVKGNIWWLD
ncbi:MAG: hypothetical protein IJY27_02695 [Clostridia bacterium]|nr:hypothetical protein [Clostridia bacterium]